jgi:hypothetical protein
MSGADESASPRDQLVAALSREIRAERIDRIALSPSRSQKLDSRSRSGS